ncbi:MAG: hypothetical protein Q4B17_12275 [Lautropia sp.]|nr:hypothetical protein [Lautropia sp.]
MPIIEKFRAAGFCLCLGAGLALSVASPSEGVAAGSTGSTGTASAAVATKGSTLDEAGIRKLLAEGQDPAVKLVWVGQRQGAFLLHHDYEVKALPDPVDFITDVANAMRRQIWVLKQNGIALELLSFSAFVPELVDDGRGGLKEGSGRTRVLHLVALPKDLQNVPDWHKVEDRLMLDVAQVSFSRAGRRAAKVYCEHKVDAKGEDPRGALFCTAVASGANKEAMSVMLEALGRAQSSK